MPRPVTDRQAWEHELREELPAKLAAYRPTGGPRIQNFDSFAPFEILKTWGPLLLFVVVWLYSMRRYSAQYRQPWDQILRRLEGIENHLARIASLLEERRGK